ncbi:hypothetical protein [Ascidiimonas sp. W6]|uniref:hypothetical protein n=1 Tax=Ascidiimonas meishanensis TaxID=3128903 RepID=UPI0030ECD83A
MKKLSLPFVMILFTSCYNYGQLEFVTELPKKLKENSGLEIIPDNNLFWLVEDSGNKDHVYGINKKGEIVRDINIKGAKNQDWEDLASDDAGNLFIGDFGNNDNERKDLVIYRIPNPSGIKKEELPSEEIRFTYPEQKDFPPKDSRKLYDAEAFLYLNDYLYIFTKNRSKPFNGNTLLYRIPAVKGTYKATLLGETSLCSERHSCMVTSADISPDKKKVVLLAHDRIWLLQNFKADDFFSGTVMEIPLDHYSQKESICFKNNQFLYITDEKSGYKGNNLYGLDLSNY